MPEFIYDIGYYGYASIDQKPLLCTSGSISLSQTQIYTNGVWGAGWYNGVKNVCFAPDYPVLTLQVGFQLTSSNQLFNTLGEFASSKRNISKEFLIYPNGIAGYTGLAYCQSISFETSQDSLVTGSVEAKSSQFTSNCFSNTSVSSNTTYSNSTVTPIASGYRSVFPYYGTTFQLGTTLKDISGPPSSSTSGTSSSTNLIGLISWSVNQSGDIVFAKCCSKTAITSLDNLYADYVAIGLLTADGSFSKFGMSQFKNASDFRKYICGSSKIKMKSVDGTSVSITMPGLSISQQNLNMQTGSTIIQCDFNFTVIGNGKDPALSFNPSSSTN